jgi:hypothetical protein
VFTIVVKRGRERGQRKEEREKEREVNLDVNVAKIMDPLLNNNYHFIFLSTSAGLLADSS